MALKFKLDSLDGLEEGLKTLYIKGEDGKFTLQLEDDPAKDTMRKIREERDSLAKSLKEREKAEADAKAAKEREDLERKGEYEKLRAQDQEALKAALAKADGLEARNRNNARDRAAMEAISAVKGIPKALLPHIVPALEVVPDGDDYKVIVKADPGKKLADFVSSLKNEMPWGFEGSGFSGSGAMQPGTNSGAKPWKDMTLDEQSNLFKSNPVQALALQKGA